MIEIATFRPWAVVVKLLAAKAYWLTFRLYRLDASMTLGRRKDVHVIESSACPPRSLLARVLESYNSTIMRKAT